MKLSTEERGLVREGVRRNLARSPAFRALPRERQATLTDDMSALTEATIAEVEPASLGGLLGAVDFPAFVSDLVSGVFESIVDASIQQMEAYADLLHASHAELDRTREGTGESRPSLRPARLNLARAAAKLDLRPTRGLPALADAPPDPEKIRALGAILVAAELDQARVFAVVDRIAEGFITGTLPLGRDGGDLLYAYIKRRQTHLGEAERANLYARALGRPGAAALVNTAFDGLWGRLLSAVVAARSSPGDAEREALREAALELARNASDHCGGTTRITALALTTQLQECLEILRQPAILAAYGAGTPWLVVERVAALELGLQINHVRARTRAAAGGAILTWLADQATALINGAALPLAPLAEAVERWLAAAAE